ncbi:MAG: hypothetical protein GY910_07950 [bacterium]|nr:hypothetical protein [Deltaproteobacteria bacterium]MCP4904899.1 hypothetical protein [bacterium]
MSEWAKQEIGAGRATDVDCLDDVCDLPGAQPVNSGLAEVTPDIELSDDDPERWLDFAEKRGWGDGLPLIPPTPARVQAALDLLPPALDPDEVIAHLPPRGGLATRRVLAINAVMAGCRPDTLPVLTTAVRALARPELNLRGVNATTHPVAPLIIVHGAAVEALGFNAGLGAFGPGCRANASVGRAMRLVLQNVAGARPGAGDAATQGQPSKYSYCVAENLPESPWESYASSVGIPLGLETRSAITVTCGENPHNVQDHECATPAHTLEQIASVMATLGSNNAPVSSAEWFVFLGPEHAASLADAGWSRRDVQIFLYEKARLPAARFRRAFEITQYADWERTLADDDLKPMMRDPGLIRVMVIGGAGKHSSVVPSWGMTASATLPLEN